jgi:ribonuclease P protein component
MLKKEHRIKKDKEFKKVMQAGRRFYGKSSLWFYLPKTGLKKVGFIVSNKVSLKASRRNRIKRQLRGLIEENLTELPDGDLVILIKKDYSTSTDLKEDFKNNLDKLILTTKK